MEDQNLTQQESLSSSPEQEAVDNTQTQAQNEESKPTRNDENIRQLRLAKEKAEKEREEYFQRLQQYEQQQKEQESAKKEVHRDPSDLAEYKDLMELRKEMDQQRVTQEQLSTEIKLRQSFPDIDQVLSADNIAKFREQEPELAAMLNANQDMYNKAAVAYKYIKKMGLGSPDPYQKEKDKMAENASKPKSSYSAGKDTPLSQLADYSGDPEARRKHVWQQMKDAINQNR